MTVLHKPVLMNEVLAVFQDVKIKTFFDGTLGAGGHARRLLEAHPEIEKYIGCDRDCDAIEIARKELIAWKDKVELVHGSHSELKQWLKLSNVRCLDGIMIDAGVSSMQLDRKERGFSFQYDGPLDMRMDQDASLTAKDIVNKYSERDLEEVLREFGEEPRARAIARQIVMARKKKMIRTTFDLVEVIRPIARGKKHLHPATLTFQALRIAVNDELNSLKRTIEQGVDALCLMGKIAVISFHRLEDRIAKNCLREQQVKEAKRRGEATVGILEIETKKPISPTIKEIRENPRCRSAKLRAAQRVR